jgi:hypothetical protein
VNDFNSKYRSPQAPSISINSSLLEQVSLENSINFDLITKSNESSNENINNDQLSSRTYVKV